MDPEWTARRASQPAGLAPASPGLPWAEIARFVGQRKLSLTADTYTHVLSDGRELDYEAVLR
jgi:hypothetical protein